MAQNDALLEVFIVENLQLLEQLESLLLAVEKNGRFAAEEVDAIFRILHTIKGSSAMMSYENMAKLSHAMEDLFSYIRENRSSRHDHTKTCDLVLSAGDFLKGEIAKLQNGSGCDGDPSELLEQIAEYYGTLNPVTGAGGQDGGNAPAAAEREKAQKKSKGKYYKAVVRFARESKMENVRAFGVVKSIEGLCGRILTQPEDLLKEKSADEIAANGFTIFMQSESGANALKQKISSNFFIETLKFSALEDVAGTPFDKAKSKAADDNQAAASDAQLSQKINYMNVNLEKLDKLMDLVGEIVITESTVTKNPQVINLKLDSFEKAARQLRKLTDELQDTVMSIRMIPISATFHKQERIVRDICKKTGKRVELRIVGEDTELDKNVIDNLSDPLMHLVRNAVDHGIEQPDERVREGKDATGIVVLEARNTGGDVIITVTDDGRGLDRESLIQKGRDRGLVSKPDSEITDKEAYSLIFAPGFSTRDAVTEFSGRGVGMDVVLNNIEKMGGSLSVNSEHGMGMTAYIRIPLTLAIIDGMQVGVGGHVYIIPVLNIRESFKPGKKDVFVDPDGNEMILIRKSCYPVYRLSHLFNIETDVKYYDQGILMMLEGDARDYCLFVDRLIGDQQTVIKPMPLYISRMMGWLKGIAGCTILSDGSVGLILDVNGLPKNNQEAAQYGLSKASSGV